MQDLMTEYTYRRIDSTSNHCAGNIPRHIVHQKQATTQNNNAELALVYGYPNP